LFIFNIIFTHLSFSFLSVSVEGARAAPKAVVRVLTMFANGFTVDTGPFRAFNDPANKVEREREMSIELMELIYLIELILIELIDSWIDRLVV
jgi:hypothetical protein